MKISIEWLKEYVETVEDIRELSDELTLSGSEVEEIERPFDALEEVITAKVTEVFTHPNADSLNICRIDSGSGTYTAITSDQTVKSGDFVAFGPAGASFASGKRVEAVELRGIMTDGVMYSLEEMGLETKSEHVFRFSEPVEIGMKLKDVLGLDLTAFELEITPNRPDCLSHVGLAREVATVEKRKLKLPPAEITIPEGEVDVRIESEGCNRYMAVKIEGVEVSDSPLWLKKRLASVGLRSINNVADATNYVMMELGHPIHAFDFDNLPSSMIIVRDAVKGERLLALNSREYEFDGDEILITDGETPLAIAGIMGGEHSGISGSTKNVLLEVASFDAVRIRKTSRKLGLSTDASYRFERGVDPNDTEFVAKRLAEMVVSLAGGKVTGSADVYPKVFEPETVKLSMSKLSSYTAINPDIKEVEEIFEGLGFKPSYENGEWSVEIPTFRSDITEAVDLVEEFSRIHGFDRMPTSRSFSFVLGEGRNEWWDFKNQMKNSLTGLGYFENLTYPFVDPEKITFFDSDERKWNETPALLNPISPEMSVMRPTLIVGLMDVLAYNAKRQEADVKLFEIGKTFDKEGETEKLALAATGRISPEDYEDKRIVSLLSLKGDIESIAEKLHTKIRFDQKDLPGLTEGRSGEVIVNGRISGFIGELSRNVLETLDLKVPVYVAELDLGSIFESAKGTEYKRYSQYPVSFRDLSMFVEKGKVKAERIVEFAKGSSEFVTDVKISDLYTGKGVPKNSYSVSLRITYGSMERTLSEEEINGSFVFLMERLEKMEGITLRKA